MIIKQNIQFSKPANAEIEKCTIEINDILSKMYSEHQHKENEIFQYSLRVYAVPEIKGELTKGKLKWRGIRLCQMNKGFEGYERWLEQRGKQISPKVLSPKFSFINSFLGEEKKRK